MLKRVLLYGPPLTVWFLVWITLFPGLMNGDSVHSWGAVILNAFDQSQTGFVPIAYSWLAHLWFTPGIIGFVHVLLMVAVLRYAYVVLREAGAPFWLLCCVTAYFTLSPFIATSLATIIKDTPAGMLQLMLLLFSIQILESNGAWLAERKHVWMVAGTLLLICLVRHEGWISATTFIVCVVIFYRSFWKPALAAAAVTLAGILVVQGPLFSMYHVSHNADIETVIMEASEIAVVYSNGGVVTPEESRVLNAIEPAAAWTAGYNPYTLNNVIFFNPQFSVAAAYAHKAELAAAWRTIALRNLPILLASRKTLGSLAWDIHEPPGSFTYAVHLQAVAAGIDPNPYGLHLTHPLPAVEQAVRAIVATTSQPEWNWLFYRPALYLYIMAGSCAVLIHRRRRLDPLLLIAPIFGRVALIGLFALSPDSRFFFYAFLMAPVIAAYAVVKSRVVPDAAARGSLRVTSKTPPFDGVRDGSANGS